MDGRSIYRGRVITLDVVPVTLPNGHQFELEVVGHPGGAAVVALNERDEVCLVRQYRHVASDWLWELPAGKLDAGTPLDNARRELAEEAGIRAREWSSLGRYFSSPGVFREVVHLFQATALEPCATGLEADEVLSVHWLPLAEACRMAVSGEIVDGKTVVALWRASAGGATALT
jgi:8-oxo-dGTP pyrophosphatase MutT (NUDIX family)